jgi:hypothetical protein
METASRLTIRPLAEQFFCCKGCQGKVKSASAEKQCEMVFVKGFDKAFAVNKEKSKPK